jgi:translation initiation factor IF-2
MSTVENKSSKIKIIALIREIEIPKEEIFKYLEELGYTGRNINATLEPEIADKVRKHFKKDIQKKVEHIGRIQTFVDETGVELEEQKRIKKAQEEKKRKEEEQRRQKELEEKKRQEELKRLEEEKRKAELEALRKQQEEQERLRLENLQRAQEAAKKEEAKAIEKKVVVPPPKPEAKEVKTETKKPQPVTKEPQLKQESTKPKVKEDKVLKVVKKDQVVPPPKQEQEKGSIEVSKKPVDKAHFQKQKKHEHIREGKSVSSQKKVEHKKVEHKKESGKPRHFKPSEAKKPVKIEEKPKREREHVSLPPQPPPKSSPPKVSKTEHRDTIEKRNRLTKVKKIREISEEEIREQIEETFAKMDVPDAAIVSRSMLRKKKKKERLEQERKLAEITEREKKTIRVTEFLSTQELANLMGVSPSEIISKCFLLGMMVTINQRLSKDVIVLIAEDFGFKVEFAEEYEEELIKDEQVDDPGKLQPRPPVVTIMGHVDHGKTSLLDYIRKTNVVAGEAGGITQHIGAYKVTLDSGKEITFLDTPGHEAFTAMRARGGQAADIVVLVVAADDSVMPQTVEAINHALAANVPIIVAINKIDKPEANPEKIKMQLADKGILIEEWGGKYQSVEISAKFGKNIDLLLEKILTEAEMLELKANPEAKAKGVVLESKLDKGKGIMATILVQNGTLKIGDCFLCGIYYGRVKAMFDERGNRMDKALPATPVQILGFSGMPQAGDTFVVMDSESEAKAIAIKRQQLKREQDFRQIKLLTLDDISKQIKEGKKVELNIIIKADTDGSAEALADSLAKLESKNAKVKVIHKALGMITESDVSLAEASKAIIIGFNVRPNLNARKLAENKNVDIRIHNIIYKVIDEVKSALEGMLEPELKEEITATVEVRQVFRIPKVGNVAGCYVQDGKISRNNKVRLLRDGLVIYEGTIASLKRLKDDVREVDQGYECGIGLENFNDIKVGDIIEAYKIVEIKQKLDTK